MPFVFLSIPEGVSVATVIIDGVDVAPAGLVRRTLDTRELRARPLGITTQCALRGIATLAENIDTVRSRAL